MKIASIFELCDTIRETSFAIHKYHRHGHLEKIYENALMIELKILGLQAQQQHPIEVKYKGNFVGEYSGDILVEDEVLVELKTGSLISAAHVAQCLNYLTATGLKICLLINFGTPKATIKRIVHGF